MKHKICLTTLIIIGAYLSSIQFHILGTAALCGGALYLFWYVDNKDKIELDRKKRFAKDNNLRIDEYYRLTQNFAKPIGAKKLAQNKSQHKVGSQQQKTAIKKTDTLCVSSGAVASAVICSSAEGISDDAIIDNSFMEDTTDDIFIENTTEETVVNPATGEIMIGGIGGVDTSGNAFGTGSYSDDSCTTDFMDDSFNDSFSSCDDIFSSADDGFSLCDDSSSSFDDSF